MALATKLFRQLIFICRWMGKYFIASNRITILATRALVEETSHGHVISETFIIGKDPQNLIRKFEPDHFPLKIYRWLKIV